MLSINMKTLKHYRIPTVPSYFSNISSIEKLAVLHDAPIISDRHIELQAYFNDLYQVFMHRFSQFAILDKVAECDKNQMAAMFEELINIKEKLQQ